MGDTSTEAVTKLLDGVTKGPWAYNVHREVGPLHTEDDIAYGMICDVVCEVNFDADHMGNASFISAARDLVPALLAERDALRKERDSAQRRHAEADATIAAAEAIIAVAETAEAERDALRRENENLRQIERNVHAVREHEYKRAEAALAEVERLKSHPITVQDAVKVPEVKAMIGALDAAQDGLLWAKSHLRSFANTESAAVNEALDHVEHVLRAIAEGRS